VIAQSVGEKTEAGKQASRCNAVRHRLTAETVIGTLEEAEDYKGFETATTADYHAPFSSMNFTPATSNTRRMTWRVARRSIWRPLKALPRPIR
jgi:hypothetical protein